MKNWIVWVGNNVVAINSSQHCYTALYCYLQDAFGNVDKKIESKFDPILSGTGNIVGAKFEVKVDESVTIGYIRSDFTTSENDFELVLKIKKDFGQSKE